MDSTPITANDAGVSLAEKVCFLSDPASYAHAPRKVRVVETHMSFVFIADAKSYKLKKPVRFFFLDFSTLKSREAMCREELRLNRRLAPDVYLNVRALTASSTGVLAISGGGATVDWLIEMRSLPERQMLDVMLAEGRVCDHEIDLLAKRLAEFYLTAERSTIAAGDYANRFFREQQINREVLTARAFHLDHGRATLVLDRLDARLAMDRPLIEERVRAGCIVDGHGDLRPEHVNFADGIAIFELSGIQRRIPAGRSLRRDCVSRHGMRAARCARIWVEASRGFSQATRRFRPAQADAALHCVARCTAGAAYDLPFAGSHAADAGKMGAAGRSLPRARRESIRLNN